MALSPQNVDMTETPSLAHSCQRGSLFDGGAHGIKELLLCNNGWVEKFVMGTGMVIHPMIPYVSMYWPPKLEELLLDIPA